jgi:hypothetical protein
MRRKRSATGAHESGKPCATRHAVGLTPPKSPQADGMAERFRDPIEDVP